MTVSGRACGRKPWASVGWLTVAVLLAAGIGRAGEALPSLEDLIKPKQEKKEGGEGEDKPQFPRKLGVEEANLQASEILPASPYFYLESGNGERTGSAWDNSAIAQLLAQKRVAKFLRDNPLTLTNLFVDLPERYANSDALNLLLAWSRFSQAFMRVDSRTVLAAYKGDSKGLQIVFLADIGRDRKAPYETLQGIRNEFLDKSPAFALEESPRGDDYIDVIRSDADKGEVAFGVVRNYVVVSTNADFAKNLVRVAKAGGADKNLGRSASFREIAQRTDSNAHVRGFIDLRALLMEAAINQLPGATEMLNLGCDLAGRGILFYDLRAEEGRVVEHVVSPAQVRAEAEERPGVPARLLQVCASPTPDQAWTSAKVVPYQPDLYIAARVKPEAFIDLLMTPQPLGASEYATQIAISMPMALKADRGIIQIIKPSLQVLEGEVAMALLPAHEGKRPWLFTLALKDAAAAQKLLDADDPAELVSGLKVYALNKERWKEEPCWTILNQVNFQNLGASQLVVASNGELMQTTIDQATAVAASLAENKDFKAQMAALGKGHSLIWYYNLPAMIMREYVNLPIHIKTYFPQLKSVSNRPPMAIITKHMFGIAGGVQPKPGDISCRSTIVSPCAVGPALALELTVNLPHWIRERARIYLRDSRSNLGKIWLALQTYATQRGHYPDSMDELRGLFPGAERKRIFISLAAVEQKSLEDAARNSYTYVLGLRPTDEPDRPILYESGPWHYEYRGMMRPKGGGPTEAGPYTRWRLVLQIDGTIRAYTEKEFKQHVLPRIKAME